MKVSVVIPCYKSGEILPEVVDRIAKTLSKASMQYEIILVDDASPDNAKTWKAIERLCETRPAVVGISLMFNTGQYRATLCGVQHSRGSVIVTMDDDLQHHPEDIPLLVSALESKQLDCVIGAFRKKKHGPIRLAGTVAREYVFRIFYKKPSGLRATGFRAFTSRVGEMLCAHKTAAPNINALLFQSSSNIENIEVQHSKRNVGSSGYSIYRLTGMLVSSVLETSMIPLKIISIFGMLSTLASVIIGVSYLLAYLHNPIGKQPGFTTLILTILFFGGASLLSFGILGAYFSIIINEVRRSPRFFIRHTRPETLQAQSP